MIKQILALCAIASLAVACSSPRDRLIGKWQSDNLTIELKADGRYETTLKIADETKIYHGKWQVVDGKHLQATFDDKTKENEFEVTDKTLKMVSDRGSVVEFKKVD